MNIHMASVSSLTASLKNGFCLGTGTRLSALREILIQDQKDGDLPHRTLNCDCTDRKRNTSIKLIQHLCFNFEKYFGFRA